MILAAGSLTGKQSDKIGGTTVGKWVVTVKTSQRVECAVVRQKFIKNSVCSEISGIDT